MHSPWTRIPARTLLVQLVPSASNNEVLERMVWDGVSVFSVEVHRLEVCAVGHIPHLVLP